MAAAKKLILKIQIDESPVLKQLGMANQFKSLVVGPESTAIEMEVQIVKMLSKGLTNEQRAALEADVGEFQIAEKVDGKIVKRFESHEKPLENKDTAPTNFIFAKSKTKKLSLKKQEMAQSIRGPKSKDKRMTTIFGKNSPFDGVASPLPSPTFANPRASIMITGSTSLPASTSLKTSTARSKASRVDRSESRTEVEEEAIVVPAPAVNTPLNTPKEEDMYLHNILKMTLGALGIPPDGVDKIYRLSASLSWEHSGNGLSPWRTYETLESMRDLYILPGLERLRYIHQIVIAQRYVRTFLATRRLRRYKKELLPEKPGGETPPLGLRLNIFRTILKDEAEFRDRMYFTFTKVERGLLQKVEEGWVSLEECSLIFENTATFRTFFSRILKKLEKFSDDWPGLQWDAIAKSIDQDFEESSAHFTTLALRYTHITTTIQALFTKPECSSYFLTLAQGDGPSAFPGIRQQTKTSRYLGSGTQTDFRHLVFDPLERLDYYSKKFGEILELTSKKRVEYAAIQTTCRKLNALVKKVQDNKVISAKNLRLSEVLTRFSKVSGLDVASFSFLPAEERFFLSETEVTLLQKEKDKWKSKDIVLMLFSDLILLLTKVEKGQAKPFQVEEGGVCLLSVAILEENYDIGDPKYPAETVLRIILEMGKDTKVDFVIALKTKQEKGTLFGQILARVRSNRMCFGKSLQEVVDHDGVNPPSIVSTVLSILRRRNAQKLEGIFRIAGEAKYLAQMKALFDRWDRDKITVDLEKFDSFDIASLLKQWFREMPEPVMTYPIYNKYVMDCDEENLNFTELLNELPPTNLTTILAVLSFCVELTKYSEQNKMTPANVSICWAPTILRPEKDTMESSMRMSRVNKVVELLVQWLSDNPDKMESLLTQCGLQGLRSSGVIGSFSASMASSPTLPSQGSSGSILRMRRDPSVRLKKREGGSGAGGHRSVAPSFPPPELPQNTKTEDEGDRQSELSSSQSVPSLYSPSPSRSPPSVPSPSLNRFPPPPPVASLPPLSSPLPLSGPLPPPIASLPPILSQGPVKNAALGDAPPFSDADRMFFHSQSTSCLPINRELSASARLPEESMRSVDGVVRRVHRPDQLKPIKPPKSPKISSKSPRSPKHSKSKSKDTSLTTDSEAAAPTSPPGSEGNVSPQPVSQTGSKVPSVDISPSPRAMSDTTSPRPALPTTPAPIDDDE